ncbi:MAG: hypothetical protein IH947_00105 [Bacteroidetes bacterium]|nr:hypothetical protein [Bacteroidota bacterium]
MAGFISLGFKILSILSFIMLIAGLYKPWMVLWWEDRQYRLKVIKLYGITGIVCWLIGILIIQFTVN